jgi:SAM-dependent methyltransferase
MGAGARYEQEHIWGQVKNLPDIQEKVRRFTQTIPEDVETILDVGCGDGAITNELARRWLVTGVDSSRAALAHVEGDAMLASAEKLPFPDRSFDLVMSSQMLEHLDDATYELAMGELRRVADRYLLISVPYKEDLGMRMVRCPRCGWVGHVWGHRRRFSPESLLRDLPGFEAIHVQAFGDLQNPPWPRPLLALFHHVFRGFYTSGGQSPLCERCGNNDFSGGRGFPPYSAELKRWLDQGKPRLPYWLAVVARRVAY